MSEQITHITTTPDGADEYACETCVMMFRDYQDHESPTRCPWGKFHE